MQAVNTIDLENLLKSELDVCLKLEESVLEKKKHLIHSDIEAMRLVDVEIERLSILLNNFEAKKTEMLKDFNKGKDFNLFLNSLTDKNSANNVSSLRDRIKISAINIQKQNKINAQLIEHALKLVEGSLMIITNAFMPETSSYNNLGKKQKFQSKNSVSSIVKEA